MFWFGKMFVDRVKLKLIAGKGGDGIVAWRREKFLPKGGPYGGNGGRGGSIILEATANLSSLDSYRNLRQMRAKNGKAGGPNQQQGANGEDIILKVPCGTLVKERDTGVLFADLTEDGERLTICEGGRGGLGNAFFKSPTNRAPDKSTPGTAGEERAIELELKLIADVGLIGHPNAGKSTFLSAISMAGSPTGAYPFTTLRPYLGIVRREDGSPICIADIPGIIEGAHQNRGLGLEFLRHIERTRILLFFLDASGLEGRSPLEDYEMLLAELSAYDPALLKRPRVIALNKVDLPEAEKHVEEFQTLLENEGFPIFAVSALRDEGLEPLLAKLLELERSFGQEEKESPQLATNLLPEA